MYLYILVLNDKKHFKIGITKDSYRLRRLHLMYDINLDESFSHYGIEDSVRLLETELKSITKNFISDQFKGQNGWSEILKIESLQLTFDYIKQKGIKLNNISSVNKAKIRKPKKNITK